MSINQQATTIETEKVTNISTNSASSLIEGADAEYETDFDQTLTDFSEEDDEESDDENSNDEEKEEDQESRHLRSRLTMIEREKRDIHRVLRKKMSNRAKYIYACKDHIENLKTLIRQAKARPVTKSEVRSIAKYLIAWDNFNLPYPD